MDPYQTIDNNTFGDINFDLSPKVKGQITKRPISVLILDLELRNELWTHRKPWTTKLLATFILTLTFRVKVKSQNGLYLA